ncbi:hypothetical protein BH09PLA1_BH09PLA1_05070 [soil metagenome]
MSEDDEPRQPHSLDYRDPREEVETSGVARAIGSCMLTVFCVYGAIMFGGSKGGNRGATASGLIAAVLFAVYAGWMHRRFGARAVVAGMWIGIAVSLLLVGICGAVL